jgi:CelD/BcsL family acetyltransferase involved in cellulose biosynthesis
MICSDYLDFILLRNRETDILPAILSFLKINNSLWDVLNLTDTPFDSESISLMSHFFKNEKISIDIKYTVCPYINLKAPWDSIYELYAPALKNTIKQKLKKFEELSSLSIYEVPLDEDINSYYLEFVRLNKLRMDDKHITSPFCNKNFMSFHEIIINELHKKGMAKLYFVKNDNEFIAGIYLLFYNNKIHYYQSGFEPAWGKYSLGTLLFHHCIKAAFDNGVDEFDFLQGDEAYKYDWTKRKRTNVKISIYNTTFKGRLLHLIDSGKNKSRDIAKGVYNLIKIKKDY